MKKPDGTGACTVTAATDAYPSDVRFTRSATGVAWIQRDHTAFPARFTRLSDCTRMDVAADVGLDRAGGRPRGPVSRQLFGERDRRSMWFRPLATGGAVSADPATLVSGGCRHVHVVPFGRGVDALIYTVDTGGNEDGVYVNGVYVRGLRSLTRVRVDTIRSFP